MACRTVSPTRSAPRASASRRSFQPPRPSPTRCSMPWGCACASCQSRPNGCWRPPGMRTFEYTQPHDLPSAVALLDGDGRVRPLAGGTDLVPLMKADIAAPEKLVDLKHVPDLRPGISEDASGLLVGALTPLAQLETDPVVRERYTALAEAAGLAATPQLRNMATLGGNLLQRPRCWYFRSSL